MKDSSNERPLRVGLISLGCAKNLVDAEIMLGALLKDGLEVTNDATQADVVVVNTCSFIDAAQEESVDTILESAQVREASNRGQGLVVSGCLPQRFRDQLPALFPEVDAFMGIDQVARAAEIVRNAAARRASRLSEGKPKRNARRTVHEQLARMGSGSGRDEDSGNSLRGTSGFNNTRKMVTAAIAKPQVPLVEVNQRPTFIPDVSTPRFRLTPRHFAYVKIAEGCNHPCSFCIIPRMRGSHRSRAQADVVAEARALLEDGVKELNLISQDSTYYGLDLRSNHTRTISSPDRFNAAARALPKDATTICTLLRELNSLSGDFWIRLLYTHPAHWTDELIRAIADCRKVARYIDIPLQHIHENMLERMRRETSREYILDLLHRIRTGIPGIALRTTFIVGFPGETERCFESLLEFIREARFERLGVFAYSDEEGTRAHGMSGKIPNRVKQQRRERAMAEQLKVARCVAAGFVGRSLRVLVEGVAGTEQLREARVESWEHGLMRASNGRSASVPSSQFMVARGEADAPDIDGRVFVRGDVRPGEFVQVKVIGHTDYDLIAEPDLTPGTPD